MFFKNYFNSVADILEAKLKGYERNQQNPADKGELCELFIKEFLEDSLSDNYKIYRGGKIVNAAGAESRQLDIVCCSKRAIKIFADKGIYPTETVKGVISITATLDLKKLGQCMHEFASIPKAGYLFGSHRLLAEDLRKETEWVFEMVTPFTCVFAYKGVTDPNWIDYLYKWIDENKPNPSLTPDLIVVNKKGMFLRRWEEIGTNEYKAKYEYTDLSDAQSQGECFSRILHELYNLSHEELYLQPDYSKYF